MIVWPDLGTRVTLRYRRPPASVPPLTDAVGHLLAIDPMVRLRTKKGAIVEVAPGDVVALRTLTDAPVRTADIRNLEHAAAAAWPPPENAPIWLDGWLLRTDPGADLAANSAFPLDISAHTHTIPAIIDWYQRRGLTPRLAIPDRLLTLPAELPSERTEHILVRDVASREPDPSGTVTTDAASSAVTVKDAPDGNALGRPVGGLSRRRPRKRRRLRSATGLGRRSRRDPGLSLRARHRHPHRPKGAGEGPGLPTPPSPPICPST